MYPPHLSWLRIPATAPDPAAAPPDTDLTWAYGWPAGQKLGADLGDLVDCRGLRVADLGCGRGHNGFSALALGAAMVAFADGSALALEFVAAVAAANDLAPRCRTHLHQWGEPLPQAPFDLILGGDILYRPDWFDRLLGTLAASLAPHGLALFSDPRQALDADLPRLASAAGLTWETTRQARGYTLVRAAPTLQSDAIHTLPP
ncbi:MAG: methyltransferase domain-containing protein [Planctomycetes bacterium]|nr:methyltransferase domain-containing protein [Planctomycetota bacterium]